MENQRHRKQNGQGAGPATSGANPVEMPAVPHGALCQAAQDLDVSVEVLVFGRMPLVLSALLDKTITTDEAAEALVGLNFPGPFSSGFYFGKAAVTSGPGKLAYSE
jgi:hypothetical protein